MALEYSKVLPQVQKMGRALSYKMQDISERGQRAFDEFVNLRDNAAIYERIQLARERDAGYRGAAPISIDGEPLNARFELPPPPDKAIVIAVDGSQVYPDIHGAAFYYLTNIGRFTFYHGQNQLPQEYSEPILHYADSDIRDTYDQLITNATVNARRTIAEMQALATAAWSHRDNEQLIVALSDGPLLFWLGRDVPESSRLEGDYHAALVHLHDAHTATFNRHQHNTSLAGYIDRPTSRFVVALLHLLSLNDEDVRRSVLQTPGDYEGLTDYWLFKWLLQPGERSALMIQQSPQNKNYRNLMGESYEIVYFYLNVGRTGNPHLARVEMPMWVARSREAVNEIHTLMIQQCLMMGNYPYALTRADEVAVIRSPDKAMLDELIRTELLRHQHELEESAKLSGKFFTRGTRQSFGQGQPVNGKKGFK